jgi:hypothetical protein
MSELWQPWAAAARVVWRAAQLSAAPPSRTRPSHTLSTVSSFAPLRQSVAARAPPLLVSRKEMDAEHLEQAFAAAAYGEYETLRELLAEAAGGGAVGNVSSTGSPQATLASLVNGRDAFGNTLLIEACKQSGHADTVAFLLQAGADVALADACGRTALHYAAGAGDRATAAALLASGADASRRDASGATPLHYSTSDAVAGVLLAADADATAVDALGRPALGWLAHFARKGPAAEGASMGDAGREADHAGAGGEARVQESASAAATAPSSTVPALQAVPTMPVEE